MKPFFTKTIDFLSGSTLRRNRGSTLFSRQSESRELNVAVSRSLPENVLPLQIQEDSMGETGSWSIYMSPSPETFDSMEDDVLYCKNNVFLKCSSKSDGHFTDSYSSSESSLIESHYKSLQLSGVATPTPPQTSNETLVPGYMQIHTRGSDFGQTLIMNWTPNHHLNGTADSTAKQRSLIDKNIKPLSLDLGQMRMIHIFYQCSAVDGLIVGGEMVITNRDRKFKIFCFKNNGLYDLIKKFRSWKYFNYQHQKIACQYIFSVFRPRLTLAQLHDEEGLVNGMLTPDMWRQLQDPSGRVLDKRLVLQTIFFRGMEPSLRKDLWVHLLGIVEFDWTASKKHDAYKDRQHIYKQISNKREALISSGDHSMEPSMFQQITNDIKRTDRSHSFYKGDDNQNIKRIENIILTYFLSYRTDITYCQGMTDILAPVLMCLNDDAEAFFCFARLVEKTPFFQKAGKRVTLNRQVSLLSALIKLLLPWFHSYLVEMDDDMSLLFAHRWLLVGMKREFKMEDILVVWEACWTNYITNSFSLFICIAVIAMYGQRAVDEDMTVNELTIHFTGIANSIPVDVVLEQARGYLQQFTKSKEIPCCLRHIMPDSYWGSPIRLPRIICNGTGNCCKGISN